MPTVELKESPLLEKEDELIKPPDYTPEEESYIKGLRKRMETARNSRDEQREEFSNVDYVSHYELNERAANTFVPPKRNKEDTNFQSGTVRQKVFALLSALVNLNLSGDISAYDKEGLVIQSLGDAMEDIITKTNELDNDEEKKYLRFYELLKQGTVFVEEVWDERLRKSKSRVKFDGRIKGVSWTTRIKKAFARPSRNIIPGLNVYLGDITKYDISEQPFIFTVDSMPYEEAGMIFGEWERWENVPRKIRKFDSAESKDILNTSWRLLEMQQNRVEVLRYQDKWNNEFAVVLNGVLMTPVGLPLPWGWEDYNIVQQNLEPIHSKFAYGKSLVSRIRYKVALLDEMLKLAVLKTQKSFMPAYINISGRVLSNRVLMPGKINHGIPPNTLLPINEREAQGITNAELAMIKEIQENINSETTSPTFAGQQARGSPTATEIVELQRQAKMVLGLTVFSVAMLEWKLEWLRLQDVLRNWFADRVVNEAREEIRNVSIRTSIEGEGMGMRVIIPTREAFSSAAVMKAEEVLTKERGMPIRLIFLNPEEVRSSKLIWQITIRPKEKNSSEMSKLLFRAEMEDAAMFGPRLNLDYLGERFASIWNEDPKKLFKSATDQSSPEIAGEPETVGRRERGRRTLSPESALPSPEKAARQRVGLALETGNV